MFFLYILLHIQGFIRQLDLFNNVQYIIVPYAVHIVPHAVHIVPQYRVLSGCVDSAVQYCTVISAISTGQDCHLYIDITGL